MGLTDITFAIRDGALGQGEAGSSPIPLLIGVSSLGELNTIEGYVDPDDFRDDYGTGPLVEAGCYYLDHPGSAGILVLRVNSFKAGDVSKTAAGETTGTMTAASSLPLSSDYVVNVEFTTGGLLGAAVMKYSLDSGVTYTEDVDVPADGTIEIEGTGLVFQFGDGAGEDGFTIGDEFDFVIVTDAEASAVTRTPFEEDEETAGTMSLGRDVAPLDAYNAIVLITQAGLLGEAAFKYSLDGGVRYSGEIAIPGDGLYTIEDTGLPLVFENGEGGLGFSAGDSFAFTTTAPGYTLDALEASLQAWLDSTTQAGFLHILGNGGTDPEPLTSSVKTFLEDAEGKHKFTFALLETRDQSDDELTVKTYQKALKTEWAEVSYFRLMVVPGYVDVYLPASKMTARRSAAWPIGGRMASRPFSEDPGRYDVGDLHNVEAIYMDARKDKTLNDSGFTLLTTYDDEELFYCQGGQMKVPTTSDYRFTKEIAVMNVACAAAYKASKKYINTNVRVDRKTGKVLEMDARSIDSSMTKAVEQKLFPPAGEQHASAVSVTFGRDSNLLSNPKGSMKVRLVPLATIRELAIDIGFENPFLS